MRSVFSVSVPARAGRHQEGSLSTLGSVLCREHSQGCYECSDSALREEWGHSCWSEPETERPRDTRIVWAPRNCEEMARAGAKNATQEVSRSEREKGNRDQVTNDLSSQMKESGLNSKCCEEPQACFLEGVTKQIGS